MPDNDELLALFERHYGDPMQHGWRVRMHHRFGYFSPEARYEAIVDRLVTPGCHWVDVGGGKSIFPHNQKLSEELASRCGVLVGVDPSDNLDQNPLVHRREKAFIEDYTSREQFDLATLRMVAEHCEEPERVVASLARLVKPGGHVVVYTPNRWSCASIAASLIPDRLHHYITGILWGTQEEDVFPTRYRMNTRRQLRRLFERGGFVEDRFAYLDSCEIFQRFRATCYAELCLWSIMRRLPWPYPENNLLGVYRKA